MARLSRQLKELVMQEYRYFDGGTCMAKVMLAMEDADYYGKWELIDPHQSDLQPHPAALEPPAKLPLR